MRFLAVLLMSLFVTPVLAYEPNQVIGTMLACKTEEAIKMLTNADRVSKEKLRAAWSYQAQQGQCGRLPRPVLVQLVEMVDSYIDFEGAKNEAWKIHNGYYIIAVDPNSKSSYSV